MGFKWSAAVPVDMTHREDAHVIELARDMLRTQASTYGVELEGEDIQEPAFIDGEEHPAIFLVRMWGTRP